VGVYPSRLPADAWGIAHAQGGGLKLATDLNMVIRTK